MILDQCGEDARRRKSRSQSTSPPFLLEPHGDTLYNSSMSFIFDPDKLHECTKKGVGLPVEQGCNAVVQALAEAFPGKISTRKRQWFFNNAGGAMGQMCVLHTSLREYLILFGSPIGTDGHSGRYSCDVWDFVFDGEVWCYVEGQMERSVYKAGDVAFLGSNQAKGYRIPDHSWMLEYARGFIPSMLPFGLADTFFSTLDFKTIGNTLRGYHKVVAGSLGKKK